MRSYASLAHGRSCLRRTLVTLLAASAMSRPAGGQAMPPSHQHGDTAHMDMAMPTDPLGVSMDRMGSGTTWIPEAAQLPSRHYAAGTWDLMLHGFVFVQEDDQTGPRGASQFGVLNWAMLMATRDLASGRFQLRTMISVEPATVTPGGYPLLLQTGESYHGTALHDRQHPHDFAMEAAALYERAIGRGIGVSFYAAPSGEPALSPVAFMHRPSAMDIPTAPLGHHWQDATHISFGVLTAGLFTHRLKVEGSAFNGREPDEHRWNIDPIKIDSYAGRVTFNPSAPWSVSGGYGYLASPEGLEPTVSEHRVTASLLHGRALGDSGQWASAFVWGAKKQSDAPGLTHSLLLETDMILDPVNTVFARAEYVQKTARDLALDSPPLSLPPTLALVVSAASIGYIRDFKTGKGVTLGLGGMGTLNVIPATIQSVYGSRVPIGGLVFLRLRPIMSHEDMHNMGGMKMDEPTCDPVTFTSSRIHQC